MTHKPHLVLIVGPTAVGKTELAIQLAERMNGEIVSVDSRLFYRGMDIGTAKPSKEEMARVPHHLIDIVYPDETLSLAVFQQLIAGIVLNVFFFGRLGFISTALYLLMGWLVVVAVKPVMDAVSVRGLIWLVAGGLSYTLGVIFFLWHRLPISHTIWHLFVLAGSAFHYFAIFFYVLTMR